MARDYFDEIPVRRRNQISYMVSCRVPKNEANLANEAENWWYDRLTAEAREIEEKYGRWPTFEMEEIPYDDPALDIYNTPVDKKDNGGKA